MTKISLEYQRVFKAFCDERRLHILTLLKNGEICGCKLLERLDMGQSALSYHMKILTDSGLVTSRQDGKWSFYKLSKEGSEYALELVRQLTAPLDNT